MSGVVCKAYRWRLVCLALAFGLAVPANAAPAGTIGDIVVTAQFRNQKQQNTPLSITTISAGQLEARGQTNIAQIAAQAPNVTLIPGGAAFGPSLGAEIRGVGQFDFNPAYEPGVGIYVDDVYYPTLTGGLFDLLDLDRVEVLRGPQGTLTGRNSEGGAIKLFSKKADGQQDAYAEAGYGNYNQVMLRAGLDLKLGNGLYARVAGVEKREDGFVDQIDYGCANPGNSDGLGGTAIPARRTPGHCRVARLGGVSQQAIRAQFRYNPSSRFDWTIAADYSHERHTNPGEVLTVSNNPNYICGRYCTYADFRTYPPDATRSSNRDSFKGGGISSNASYSFSDAFSLTSITAWRRYVATFGTDDDFGPDPVLAADGDNRLSHHFFSQELRLNGRLGSLAEFTLGGFLSNQKTVYFTRQDIRYVIPGVPFQFIGNDPVRARSRALFGTVILHPAPRLTLTGGLRYTRESKDYTFVRRAYDGGPVTGLAGAFGLGALDGLTSRYKGSRVDYRASVDYRFSPAVMAYATYSTGFKGGGVSARPFTAEQALDGTFRPETLTNYEIGLKSDLFDRRLRLNLSAFVNRYKDIQLQLSDCSAFGGGPCGVVANAGNAHFKGVELEMNAAPVAGLLIDGSLSWLHSRYTSLNPSVGGTVLLSDPATSAPKWKWSAGVQYTATIHGRGSLTPRLDVSHNGRMFEGHALGRPYFLPGYTLANARLTWRNQRGDLSISAECTNLFNKYHLISIFDAVYAFSGTAYQQVGRPREFALSVRKGF